MWERWRTLRNAGFHLFFHFAPPCSTFSRARDRSSRTRLRSAAHPEGLYEDDHKTEEANDVARNTALSIRFLVSQLGACGTLEQPASSYMMSYLDKVGLLDEHKGLLLHQCRFGRPYRKPTALLVFGDLDLSPLALTCSKVSSCGRAFHTVLGFGGSSTADAAAYPSGLCAAYAGALFRNIVSEPLREEEAIERLTITAKGVVHRHIDRGTTAPSLKARRAREDAESRAGWAV